MKTKKQILIDNHPTLLFASGMFIFSMVSIGDPVKILAPIAFGISMLFLLVRTIMFPELLCLVLKHKDKDSPNSKDGVGYTWDTDCCIRCGGK